MIPPSYLYKGIYRDTFGDLSDPRPQDRPLTGRGLLHWWHAIRRALIKRERAVTTPQWRPGVVGRD